MSHIYISKPRPFYELFQLWKLEYRNNKMDFLIVFSFYLLPFFFVILTFFFTSTIAFCMENCEKSLDLAEEMKPNPSVLATACQIERPLIFPEYFMPIKHDIKDVAKYMDDLELLFAANSFMIHDFFLMGDLAMEQEPNEYSDFNNFLQKIAIEKPINVFNRYCHSIDSETKNQTLSIFAKFYNEQNNYPGWFTLQRYESIGSEYSYTEEAKSLVPFYVTNIESTPSAPVTNINPYAMQAVDSIPVLSFDTATTSVLQYPKAQRTFPCEPCGIPIQEQPAISANIARRHYVKEFRSEDFLRFMEHLEDRRINQKMDFYELDILHTLPRTDPGYTFADLPRTGIVYYKYCLSNDYYHVNRPISRKELFHSLDMLSKKH